VNFARSIHREGVLLDKAAVLHYARILSKDGQWVSCECCFTIVHDVLVACTSIYLKGEKSTSMYWIYDTFRMRANRTAGRALDAPQIRRIFSNSPRDPRYHMLEHMSPKFTMPPRAHEPRAALILNRFTRNLSVMFATNAVTSILGLRPDEIKDKPFYECIQENCLQEAIRVLESAKANESIAYLRFWFRDPRVEVEQQEEDDEDEEDEDDEEQTNDGSSRASNAGSERPGDHMEIDKEPESEPATQNRRGRSPSSFELEAVVSCTSDGLVVVLRRARPPILEYQPAVPGFNPQNGLFAAPWGQRPIEPHIPPELIHIFRPPLLPQHMPLRDNIKAAGGPPMDQLMLSIRDVAVFAWAVSGINGNMADYGHGLPRRGAQPIDGLPIWDPNAGATSYQGPENQALNRWNGFDRCAGCQCRGLTYGHECPYVSEKTGHMAYSQTRRQSLDDRTHTSRRMSPEMRSRLGVPYASCANEADQDQMRTAFARRNSYQCSEGPLPPIPAHTMAAVTPVARCVPAEPWTEATRTQTQNTSRAIPSTEPPTSDESRYSSRYLWQ